MSEEKVITSYKGFNKDMTCRGFQYEEGKDYETDKAEACETGFHACEYPLDCFGYYAPASSEFHVVEQSGELSRNGGDSKVASTKIHIGAKISIAGMVKAAIEFTMSRIKPEAKSDEKQGASSATGYKGASSATGYKGASSATGDYGASSATGDYGASSATGDYGASSATGSCGASSATGYKGASSATGSCGASSATGDYGASSATGDKGASSATGYKGASSATGDKGASSATGYKGASSATGDKGASVVTGYQSVSYAGNETAIAVAWGIESSAKGIKGATLVLSEWVEGDDKYVLKDTRLVRVDGETIKEDVAYTLKDGEAVEA